MQKSRIEWTDYTLNPIKGLCPIDCKDSQGKSYCYARRMYKRFKWNFEIRFEDNDWSIPVGSRVFVGSTIDLFHEKTIQFLPHIMKRVDDSPGVTFIFLTKCPQNLPRAWPDNCWVGCSATNGDMCYDALESLYHIKAAVKFISFEPLLDKINSGECSDCYRLGGLKEAGIGWVIIGQQTPCKAITMPKVEWVEQIVETADEARIPVFLKDNLYSLWYNKTNDGSNQIPQWATGNNFPLHLRREFPNG